MSEQAPEETAGPAATEDGAAAGGDDPTLHQLAERVDRLAGLFEQFMEGGGGHAEPEPVDIKRQVREAVREVAKADKDKAAEAEHSQSIEDRLASLEHKAERTPREFKKATQRMGWVLESER